MKFTCYLITQFVTLLTLIVTSVHAAYECPNPSTELEKQGRCQYIRESKVLYDQWARLENTLRGQPPSPGILTVEKLLTLKTPIALDCRDGHLNQNGQRRTCSRQERDATGCLAPSRIILDIGRRHANITARCQQFSDQQARTRCIARRQSNFSTTYLQRLSHASQRLDRIATARYNALVAEEPGVCNLTCKQTLTNTTADRYVITVDKDIVYVGINNPLTSTTVLRAGTYTLRQASLGGRFSHDLTRVNCRFYGEFDNGATGILFEFKEASIPTLRVISNANYQIETVWNLQMSGLVDGQESINLVRVDDLVLLSGPQVITVTPG